MFSNINSFHELFIIFQFHVYQQISKKKHQQFHQNQQRGTRETMIESKCGESLQRK